MADKTTYVIDRAGQADSVAFVASTAGLFEEDGGTRDPHIDVAWPDRHGVEDFTRDLNDPDRLHLLARGSDRRVYGHLMGICRQSQSMRPSARTAVLLSMRVAPEARRQGVGTRLVGAFLDWAREQQFNEVTVTAYASNESALSCYRRNGFKDFEIVLRAEP